MTNAYADSDTLKSSAVLNITGTSFDTQLRILLETASRLIDHYCNRHYYVLVATRKFDGDGGTTLPVPDLISVTSLKTDDNKDRTFETTWAATDYLLYPPNADPTNYWGRPYGRILVDTENGSQSEFIQGMQTVEINGKWGYRDYTGAKVTTMNDVGGISATTEVWTVASAADIGPGHTVLVDSEQMYVKSISGNDLTVIRGVNGTTAASHSDGVDIFVYNYPAEVTQACIMQTGRLWERRVQPFAPGADVSQPGSFGAFTGLDPDVRQLLSAYRRFPLGVGT